MSSSIGAGWSSTRMSIQRSLKPAYPPPCRTTRIAALCWPRLSPPARCPALNAASRRTGRSPCVISKARTNAFKTSSPARMFPWAAKFRPTTCPAHGKHSFPVYDAARPRASTTPTWRCAASLSDVTSFFTTSFGATPRFSIASASGPYAVFAYAWLATAPTRAAANGTTAPTATNLDSTATPRSLVFGSNATILNVEGRARVIAAGNGRTLFRRFPVPVTLKVVPRFDELGNARPPRSVWSLARPREDVPRIPGTSCGAPGGPFRKEAGHVEAGPRRRLGHLRPANQRGRLGREKLRGCGRRPRRPPPPGHVRARRRNESACRCPRRFAGTRAGGDGSGQRAIPGCPHRNRTPPRGRAPGVCGHRGRCDERRGAPRRRPVRPDRRDLHGPFAERAERTIPLLARDAAAARCQAHELCPRGRPARLSRGRGLGRNRGALAGPEGCAPTGVDATVRGSDPPQPRGTAALG